MKFFRIDSGKNKKNVFLGGRISKPTTVRVAFQDMFCVLAKLTDEVAVMIMEFHHANQMVFTSNLNTKTIPEFWASVDISANVFWR